MSVQIELCPQPDYPIRERAYTPAQKESAMNALLGGGYTYGHQTYEDQNEPYIRARESVEADDDAMYDLRCDVVQTRHVEDAQSDLETLSSAAWVLGRLFDGDLTIAQLFAKSQTDDIVALRNLLALTKTASNLIDRAVEAKAQDIVEGITG